MQRQSVTSSNVRSVGYDADTLVLEVEFHSGGVYAYTGVPPSVYHGLISSASVGGYLAQHIKDRYPFRKVG